MVENNSLNISYEDANLSRTVSPRRCKMGLSKDTLDIKSHSGSFPALLKPCIQQNIDDESDEKVPVKKAKSVHFADSLGKPLKSVKTLLSNDDDFDLSFLSLRSTTRRTFPVDIFKKDNFGDLKNSANKLVNFRQPVLSNNFQTRVEKDNVCLENVIFRDYDIFATVAVRNIAYEKHVTVRYTLDKWDTHHVKDATYVPGSSTGLTDTFSFEIIPPERKSSYVEIQFALCFCTGNQTFWDSNDGKNYILQFKQKTDCKKTDSSFKNSKNIESFDNYNGFILQKDNFIGWAT